MVRRPHLLLVLVLTALTCGLSASQSKREQRPEMSGTWMRTRGAGNSFGSTELTNIGQRVFDAYDYQQDDPAFRCVAASWARVWGNTDVVVQITQAADHVRIQYEWLDIDRRLELADPADGKPARTKIKGMRSLGSSAAWYDGDALVIDTIDYGPGYLDTVNVNANGTRRAGLPQSTRMHTIERLRRDGDELTVAITHVDAAYYNQPFVVRDVTYGRMHG